MGCRLLNWELAQSMILHSEVIALSKQTKNLGLFQYDPQEDGAQTFNIDVALNENWDKIDDAMERKADLDESGKIPAGQLPDMDVSGSINTHNDDPAAHPALRNLISALDTRVALLELMYGTEVAGNPFVVTFGSLNDLTVSGVWNAPMERIEF